MRECADCGKPHDGECGAQRRANTRAQAEHQASVRDTLGRALQERGIDHHMDEAAAGIRVWLTPGAAAHLAEALEPVYAASPSPAAAFEPLLDVFTRRLATFVGRDAGRPDAFRAGGTRGKP